MIRLEDVRFAYHGGPDVIRVPHLDIPRGLLLLLGPNGAGKSTLLRLIAGVERPRQGRILVEGLDLWRREVEARSNLVYVPEQPELTPYATIEEIVRLVCQLRGVDEAAGKQAIDRVGLGREARRSVRELSQGQRRRAVMAAALIGEASVLLLDEPLEAMDRGTRDDLLGWIHEASAVDRTVIVASHDFERLTQAAHAALAVEEGEVTLHEAPADVEERRALFDRLARGGSKGGTADERLLQD